MKKLLAALAVVLMAGVLVAQEVYVEPPLEFSDTQVRTALDTIFLKAGNVPYSIETKPGEDLGLVTLKLTEKTELDALLKLILDPKGLVYEKDANGVYHIKKPSAPGPVAATQKITKLYALTYATAGEIVRQVKGVLTKEGVISVDVGTNSLIITDDPSVFEGVENLLKELDNPERKAKLIAIKTRLMELTRKTDTTYDSSITYVKSGTTAIGGGVLSGLNFATTLGGAPANTFMIGAPFSWVSDDTLTTITAGFNVGQDLTSVEMIAEPDVIVEDGTEARVQVGTKEPIVTQSTANGQTSVTFTYQDVNMMLTVTPQSQRDGTISVMINPQLNQIAGYKFFTTGSSIDSVTGQTVNAQSSVPVIDNREVRTKLFVSNGGTIRLGGILKDRTTISESKIPFLGDIPIIGLLFKHSEPIVEKVDLQMLVSPHIVDYAPPRCKDTPWISMLEATMVGEYDVKVDWSKDLPFGANGVFTYNVYRDTNPIVSLEERRPFATGISGDSTSWIDMTRKRRGGTYYYVVTAINPSGMEQSISPDPKYNGVITIPER